MELHPLLLELDLIKDPREAALHLAGICVLFTLLGLWLAWLLFGKRDRMSAARDDSSRLVNRLHEIIEDQNVLLNSVTNKYGVEQKRWNLQIANRDSKLQEMSTRLSEFDNDSPTVRANLNAKEDQIRKLNISINEKTREIQQLKKSSTNERGLTERIAQLEDLLKQRDQEIRKFRAEQQSQNDEWNRLLQLKEQELEEARNQVQEVPGDNSDLLAEIERLRNERAQQEKDINELLSGRDDELNRLRAERRNFEGSDSKVRELEHVIQNKNSEIDSLKNAQMGRVQELEDILGERESMIVALQTDLAAQDGLRDQQGRIIELEDRVTRLKRELADRGDSHHEVQRLENELRGRVSEYETLRNQFETSRRDRDARIQELNDMLRDRDEELNRTRAEVSNNEGVHARISELEWQLNEKNGEIETTGKRIEELEYLLWEKNEQLEGSQSEKQAELNNIQQEKDSIANKLRELEWLLGEKDRELEFLRHEKTELESKASSSEGLTSRVEELERSLREREGEVERWWNENEALKKEVHSKETEIDRLRREQTASDNLNSKIQELEWLLGERDGELERLRLEHSSAEDLQFRLRDLERLIADRERETTTLQLENERLEREARYSRVDPALESRVRDLERIIGERDREIIGLRSQLAEPVPPVSPPSSSRPLGLSSIERASDQDLHSRIRELERLIDDSKSKSAGRSPLPTSSSPVGSAEFRLTLEDGTVVYVKGDEQIEYQGRVRSASEIFNSMNGGGNY